ncbi:hypothetical protein GDO81_019556 [Engystomops pustulosus]|uniref:Uncharacterized protein n=1 Tax=Engystomops pustulosus TaxID=76066 RepID=A0AAV6ZUX4_ENGPU|nr:hypothetical protein GDO81_019556 [Engystomops pustulosus]
MTSLVHPHTDPIACGSESIIGSTHSPALRCAIKTALVSSPRIQWLLVAPRYNRSDCVVMRPRSRRWKAGTCPSCPLCGPS